MAFTDPPVSTAPLNTLKSDSAAVEDNFFKKMHHHLFKDSHHVIFLHKSHFKIDLREFRLAIRPEIFIPETPNNLMRAFKAGHHEQLFEEMGGRWWRVKRPPVYTARDEIIPCPFRS